MSENRERRTSDYDETQVRRKSSSSSRKSSSKKKTLRKKKQRRRIILLVVGIILIIALIIGLFAWSKLDKMDYQDIGEVEINDLDEETVEILNNYTTIALFGVDNRSNGNYDTGNSDSIIICNINNDTKEVQLVSVYRDTSLDVSGSGSYKKCNYAYNHGGASEAVAMLNRNLDLNIQEYVACDFNALVDAIDALDGIDLDITSEEISENAGNLNAYIDEVAKITGSKGEHITSAGTHHCNGVQATAYCRLRYTSGDDFKRTERQRTVLSKMAEKLKTMSVSQANNLVDAILPKISTSLSKTQILDLATDVASYNLTTQAGFPFNSTTGTYGSKGSLVVPCTLESNVLLLHQLLYDRTDYEPSETVQRISSDIKSFSGCSESSATIKYDLTGLLPTTTE